LRVGELIMCGLAGFFSQSSGEWNDETVQRMTVTLAHRGPDDGGVWIDRVAGIALGHRRLSIQDISPEGHQPMASASGRYQIVFNGEIYNFRVLRKELRSKGFSFHGHSDTEVMLAAIEAWGVSKALTHFVGMFAFALWDKEERKLFLARDRIGEKPLYCGWQGDTFLFSSELKALCAHPAWRGEVNRNALALYMRHNCIPAPYTIYQGIFKLSPGTLLCMTTDMQAGHFPEPQPYWRAKDVVEDGLRNPLRCSDAEVVEQLDVLLRQSIREKMISDVPLGAFLSGGIDSSLIVALMQAESRSPVKTFTIGFPEQGYNEAEHAKAVAQHLGTEHAELYVTPQQAMDVIPKLPLLYDEPFSDSSQIPTFMVSEMTRQHVTVALSGDGGDELFGGYNRYFMGRSVWNRIGWMPRALRGGMASLLTSLSPRVWDTIFSHCSPVLPSGFRQRLPGDKLYKLAGILDVPSPEAMYGRLVTQWQDPASIVLHAHEPPSMLTDRKSWPNVGDFTQRMMYLDLVTYLPDDILTKVDRAAMGVSLETRVPFLDHRLVEFAWRLSPAMKIRNGQGKWILRQLLNRYVPQEMIERPKMGFGIPIDAWLRGPLREWAEELLSEQRLGEEGFFAPASIRRKWGEHLSGRYNWQHHLWTVLMFQAWNDKWKK